MSEERATRWRRMGWEQRERLMSAVAAVQTGLDDLADEALAEALLPEHGDFLHPSDRQALEREQHRRGGKVRYG